jgi:hypothetical protein
MRAPTVTATNQAVAEPVCLEFSLLRSLLTVNHNTDPTLNPSYLTNDPESGVGSSSAGYTATGGFGSDDIGGGDGPPASANVWESRLGLRVDVLAALAYLGGPLAGTFVPRSPSSFSLLIFLLCSVGPAHPGDGQRLRPIPW